MENHVHELIGLNTYIGLDLPLRVGCQTFHICCWPRPELQHVALDVLEEGAAEGLLLRFIGHKAVAQVGEPALPEFAVGSEVLYGECEGEGEEEEEGGEELAEGGHLVGICFLYVPVAGGGGVECKRRGLERGVNTERLALMLRFDSARLCARMHGVNLFLI